MVQVPIQVADYQYVKLEAGVDLQIHEGESRKRAFRRAWHIAEQEVEAKRNEYLADLQ